MKKLKNSTLELANEIGYGEIAYQDNISSSYRRNQNSNQSTDDSFSGLGSTMDIMIGTALLS